MLDASRFERFAVRYTSGAAAAIAATLVRLALNPILSQHSPYLPYVLGVIVAARFGGRGPSFLATALGAVSAWYFFIEPYNSFAMPAPAAAGGLVLFIVVGIIIALLIGQVRSALILSVRNEERFRNLFESMDEGFTSAEMIFDETGQPVDFRYLAANPAFAKQTGLSVEQVVGRTVREVIPGIEPYWIETYGRVVRTGQSERISSRAVPLGKHFEVFAWRSAPGQFAVVFADVTGREEAEAKLRYLADIVLSTDDAIIGEDLNGAVASWNPAAERMYGYTAAEIIGQPFARLRPSDQDAEPEIWSRISSGSRVEHHETVRLGKDGQPIDVSVTLSPITDASGKIVGCAHISRDITDRKRAEKEIMLLNATLERRIEERTAQLRDANRELEAFSYSVSHDLRAPLRTVEGFARILIRDYAGGTLDEKAVDLMKRMSAATQRMGQLIEDLLALSRITRQEVSVQSVDLSEIASGILEELKTHDPQRSVNTTVEPDLIAGADPRLIRVALDNLICNAWKFTSQTAAPRIAIGAARDAEQKAYFVSDNGAGFDMAYADQLFAPFQRLHRSEEFEGTGIGLATVQRIIRRHGGRVWAQAEPGHGAVFYFTLGAT